MAGVFESFWELQFEKRRHKEITFQQDRPFWAHLQVVNIPITKAVRTRRKSLFKELGLLPLSFCSAFYRLIFIDFGAIFSMNVTGSSIGASGWGFCGKAGGIPKLIPSTSSA